MYAVDTGERVARYECGANVREMSFTDDGRRIVLGDQAGRVHVLALDGWQPAPTQPWTPEELEQLRAATEARTPARRGAAAKKKPSAKKKTSAKKSAKKTSAKKKKSPAAKAPAKKSTRKA